MRENLSAGTYSVMVSDYYKDRAGDPVSLDEMRALSVKYKIVLNLNERFFIHRFHKKFMGCDL